MSGKSRSKRILIFAEGVTLAHVGRPLVIAQELIKLGYEVHFAVDPRFKKFMGAINAQIHSIHSLPTEVFLKRVSIGRPLFTYPELAEDASEDLALIDAIKPDVIISDLRWSLTASARLRGVRLITITNAYWSPYGKQEFVLPSYPVFDFVGYRNMQMIFSFIRPFAFAALNTPLNKLRKKYNLPPLGSNYLDSHIDGDAVLYADMHELHPVDNAPDSHYYMGALTWSPEIVLPNWWNNIPVDKPIIYVSMGSSGAIKILPKIFAALATLPVSVIATTAGRAEGIATPDNCYVADYLPGLACVARSSLIITNGGSPSSYQGIISGVPVLGVPALMDQHFFMQGVKKAGAGEIICSSELTVQRFRGLVEKMLGDENYKIAAMALADKAKNYSLAGVLVSALGD